MKAYYMNDTGSQFCCSKQIITDFSFFKPVLFSQSVFWLHDQYFEHWQYFYIISTTWNQYEEEKKKNNKSTIIDLAAFKKPHQSITLGDATLVIKMCFNRPRTQN